MATEQGFSSCYFDSIYYNQLLSAWREFVDNSEKLPQERKGGADVIRNPAIVVAVAVIVLFVATAVAVAEWILGVSIWWQAATGVVVVFAALVFGRVLFVVYCNGPRLVDIHAGQTDLDEPPLA